MKLIVGLGNPGKDFVNTRHNIGFMMLDYLRNDNYIENKKMNAMEFITNINGEKVIFIKPLTFMNLSGESVIKYVNYYKISLDDILVIQDDIDMNLGRIKLTFDHNDGGHNGIKNIILNLETKKFLRLKIGISSKNKNNIIDFVLGKFSKEEIKIIYESFDYLNNFFNDFIDLNRDLLMGKYNSLK